MIMKTTKKILFIILLTISFSCCNNDDSKTNTAPIPIPAPDVTIGQISIPIVNIPKGTFKIGSPLTEPNRNPDETQHLVTLSAFKMSKYEISNAQFAEFLELHDQLARQRDRLSQL